MLRQRLGYAYGGKDNVKLETDKMRILVAEEDMVQRLILHEYLEMGSRFEIVEATGVYHLLSLCESPLSRVGFVLLDMEWSRVDGVEMILEIRKRNPSLPILGMTDRRADFYDDVRLRRTVVGFIPKPFAPQHLHRSIQAVLKAQEKKRRALPVKNSPPQLEIRSDVFLRPRSGIHG
jgi:DNA-binding NtrC family response regulator